MKILHIDIETAPNKVYTWGLFNQNVGINQIVESGYTMCFAAKWHGKSKIMFSGGFGEDGHDEMIESAWNLLDEADVVVHYNGTKFDIPTLNKEFLLLGHTPPSSYHQIDLLKTMRRKFRFTSNKLDYVAQQLGLGSKVSHRGMDLWHDCMTGNKKAQREMMVYNKQDVVLTESLYNEVLPWIEGHPNHALYTKAGDIVCTSCGSSHIQKRGFYTTKTQRYQRYQCNDCHSWSRAKRTEIKPADGKNILTGIQI